MRYTAGWLLRYTAMNFWNKNCLTPLKTSLSLALICLFTNKVTAMSLFDIGKAYVFSPVRLTLTLDGKPLKETKVIRRWAWNDDGSEDYAFTNGEGFVAFPEVRQRGITQIFPAEFVTSQQIAIVIDNKEERIWSSAKRSPTKNSELGGMPLELSCELNNEEKMYRDFGPPLLTKCTWGGQSDI